MNGTFLRGLLGAAVVAAFLVGPDASAADKKTERLWKSKCSSCHGMDGVGDTKKGKELEIRSLKHADAVKKSDADLKKAIVEGVKEVRDGKKKEMEPFKDELDAKQVDALVKYIREIAPPAK